MKKLLLATFFVLASWLSSQAQTQMLLPYNDLAFQSSWANAAVRPMHRFSIGLPVISSLEAGVINNAFSLRDISKGDSKRTWYPSLVVSESENIPLHRSISNFLPTSCTSAWRGSVGSSGLVCATRQRNLFSIRPTC